MVTWRSAVLVLLFVAACSPTASQLGRETVTARFWAGPGAGRDPRVIEVAPHCCCTAMVAVARVSALPRPGSRGPIEVETVVELDGAGAVIRRWPMPADAFVAGITGDQILVPLARMHGEPVPTLLISPGGAVRVTTAAPSPEPVVYDCPPVPEFGNSAYLRCFEFRDLSNGEPRRLAFQGPCT